MKQILTLALVGLFGLGVYQLFRFELTHIEAHQSPVEIYGGTITHDGKGGYDFAGTFTGDEVKHFYELGHGRWPAGATSVTYEELNEAMENARKELEAPFEYDRKTMSSQALSERLGIVEQKLKELEE